MTTLSIKESTDRRVIEAAGFRLVFRWIGDRWTHSLELDQAPSRRPIVRALEGDADRDREGPARVVSPAYQQLQFQESGNTLQALLVGQSGPHHFSSVFSVQESEGEVNVEVEVADRCRSEVSALASTYVVSTSAILEATSTRLIWDPDIVEGGKLVFSAREPGRLVFSALEPGRVDLREAGPRALHAQVTAKVESAQRTHRWEYSWRWSKSQKS